MQEDPKEMNRLYKLLSDYQLGILGEAETEEMKSLQRKIYGDSIMYRDVHP
jgi:hypothetical protein